MFVITKSYRAILLTTRMRIGPHRRSPAISKEVMLAVPRGVASVLQ